MPSEDEDAHTPESVFLISDGRGRAQTILGGAIPGLFVPIRKQAE